MKIINLLAIVLMSSMVLAAQVSAEQTDSPPSLRGIMEGTQSSPPYHEDTLTRHESSEVYVPPTNMSEVTTDIHTDTDQPLDRALKGGVVQTELSEPQDSLSGKARSEVAAIGISWNLFTRTITYVDPGSDLFGKIEVGRDKFIGLGKLDAVEVVRTGYSIGDSDTWVDAVIRGHDHTVRHIPVRRRPVSNFAPKFARSFARQYKLHH